MDYQKKVSDIIELALTEKTFSLEVINKIKQLRDDVISLSNMNEQANKTIEDLRKEKIETNNLLEKATNRLANIETRETELVKKEKEQEKLRYELGFQKQRADEIKSLFDTVFRNPVILRSKMVGHVTPPNPSNSYGRTTTTSDSEREEIS